MILPTGRKLTWKLAAFLVLLSFFTESIPWFAPGHVQAMFIWAAVCLLSVDYLFRNRENKQRANHLWLAPLALFAYGLLSTTLLSGNPQNVFFGADNHFIGSWTLLSCILGGLLIGRRLQVQSLAYFYWALVILAVGSIVLDSSSLMAGERLAGLVMQSNLLAVLLGTGLIVGLFTSFMGKWQYLLLGHTILISGVLLTRTRAVIYLLPLWLVCMGFRYRSYVRLRQRSLWYGIVLAVAVAALAAVYAAPRLLSASRDVYGVSYRAELIQYSSKYLAIMPPWGLGPGGLTNVIGDYYPLPESLRHTVAIDQKIPENSHTIFLDRFLEYGWIPGIAYLATVVMAALAAWRTRRSQLTQVLAVTAGYLLLQQSVSITSPVIEFLTWTCLVYLLLQGARSSKPPSARRVAWGLMAILYIAVLGWFIQLRLDGHNAQVRLANGFVFPLDTTKDNVQAGSSFNGQVLVWSSDTPQSYHHDYMAADIHVAEGTPVLAAKGGEVVAVRNVGACTARYFPAVTIRAVDGFYYYYTHLKPGTTQVEVGEDVETGQNLAQIGSATCAQGSAPHLHLDISRFPQAIRGGRGSLFTLIDPQPALIEAYQSLPQK